jgi:menaquinol-cytochrome c reductase iron-sulfur subunit
MGTAALVPVAAGLLTFLNPLRRRAVEGEFIWITSLEALPEDGAPRRFAVAGARRDAWTGTASVPLGAVYLRRTGSGEVRALNVVCPHAGCFVRFSDDSGRFECPCHRSHFDLEGRISSPGSPSPRGLDALDVEVREESEVWVRFQNFRTGRANKVPV